MPAPTASAIIVPVSEPDEHTPIDAALELCVYAPLGFALEARTLLPRFVERGRNQVALARVVGKFAVRKGREDLEAQLVERQGQAIGALRSLGVLPGGRPATDAGGAATAPSPPRPAPTVAPAPGPAAPSGPPVDVEALAVPDYDSLSASQVVPRLASLTGDELELVRRYEQANRARKTILNKIAQLQAA